MASLNTHTDLPLIFYLLLKDFYQDLYENKGSDIRANDLQNHTKNLNIPKLSNNLRLRCEGQLTYTEYHNVLEKLKNNKSPGNDGLTAEFCKKFWPTLENFYLLIL